jgi:hypothetical protein
MRNGRAPCDGIFCGIEGNFMVSPERITVRSTGMREKGDDYGGCKILSAKTPNPFPAHRTADLRFSYILISWSSGG